MTGTHFRERAWPALIVLFIALFLISAGVTGLVVSPKKPAPSPSPFVEPWESTRPDLPTTTNKGK